MTIEEINEIAPYHPNEWQQGYGIWQHGFMEGQKSGALEQKDIDDEFCAMQYEKGFADGQEVGEREMLDKACEWLKLIGKFRKAEK